MLRFIGIGSAFNTAMGNNSAYYKNGSSILIIDCGGNVFSRIMHYEILNNISNIYVLITHTHPDHFASLGDLIFYAYYAMNTKVTILTPDAENIILLLKYMGVNRDLFNLRKLEHENKISENKFEVSISYYNAVHVKELNCYSYMLELEGKRIFYSGDSSEMTSEMLAMLETGYIDIYYQDTSSFNFKDNPHLSFTKLCEVIKPDLRKNVFCMHIDEKFDKLDAIKQGFSIVQLEQE